MSFPLSLSSTFQLTSSRRGWLILNGFLSPLQIFQLTSSRRGWRVFYKSKWLVMYFNSHPHEEDDLTQKHLKINRIISTHILTKRMTALFSIICLCMNISTHILTKRMTWFLYNIFFCKIISTHILTKRMTDDSLSYEEQIAISTHILTKRMTIVSDCLIAIPIFQLTSSRRGWHLEIQHYWTFLIFQLTSSRRGWQQF